MPNHPFLQIFFCSAPQPCNTCHHIMCRSQGSCTEAAEPLCKGVFHLQHALREHREPCRKIKFPICLTVFAGARADYLPDAEKECRNTRLGQHHRAEKCPRCDEESGGGHHLDWCAGQVCIAASTFFHQCARRMSSEASLLCCRLGCCMKREWGKLTAVTPARGRFLCIAAPGSKHVMQPATLRGESEFCSGLYLQQFWQGYKHIW